MYEPFELLQRLERERSLTESEYAALVAAYSPALAATAAQRAAAVRQRVYGRDIYIRGLIEIGNVCGNDCLYCGIRRSNSACRRYVLSPRQILDCCATGYALGLRSFVLQSGQGSLGLDALCRLIERIKTGYPDCALSLSLGEYGKREYRRMFAAGADRYLLRHETADRAHYQSLHPPEMSFERRIGCLYDLRSVGFQVGCGFMVGSPGQRPQTLAADLKFIETLAPEMCGIGPFIPADHTPFAGRPAGSVPLTLFLLSLIRLMLPQILLPATTALASLAADGREQAILAGANVVMPNISPPSAQEQYTIYNNKLQGAADSAAQLRQLEGRMQAIGYRFVFTRGDVRREATANQNQA